MKTLAYVITSRCSSCCLYCISTKIDDLNFIDFKKSLDEDLLKFPFVTKIVLTGGEPELNKDFIAMCQYVKNKNLKLKIHSNFKNISSELLNLVDEVSIAVDDINKDINDKLRGKGSLEKALYNINYFLSKNVKIQLHTVFNSINKKNIIKIFEYFNDKDFFNKNSWKIFRYKEVKNIVKLSVSDYEWNNLKKTLNYKNINFVDDISSY